MADVYKAGVLAGELRRTNDSVSFRYLPAYLQSKAVPAATTLPVSEVPIETPVRSVSPFFAGLLPEGGRLTALRSAIKTSADDDFSLLLAIGEDPIGDVQVIIRGEPRPIIGRKLDAVADFSTVSFTELFARAIGVDPDRGGVAGMQDKVSGRMIRVPIATGMTSAILKFDPPEFPHLVKNEAFFLSMARSCAYQHAIGVWCMTAMGATVCCSRGLPE